MIVASFVFRQKASAPHTILIQNSDNIEGIAAEPLYSDPTATEVTADSDIASPPEKTAEKPATINEPAELKKEALSDNLKITQRLVSWGFSSASNRKIDTVIIHSSYNALGGDEYDVSKLIAEYKEYGVAPHYLIDREGKIYQLVADKNIAYHAGESKVPDGRTQVNNFSLGIEMINTKEDKYTSAQYASLNSLIAKIKSNYSIKYVLGHNDISPGRKTDPWNFDWEKVK